MHGTSIDSVSVSRVLAVAHLLAATLRCPAANRQLIMCLDTKIPSEGCLVLTGANLVFLQDPELDAALEQATTPTLNPCAEAFKRYLASEKAFMKSASHSIGHVCMDGAAPRVVWNQHALMRGIRLRPKQGLILDLTDTVVGHGPICAGQQMMASICASCYRCLY